MHMPRELTMHGVCGLLQGRGHVDCAFSREVNEKGGLRTPADACG